MVMPVGNRLYVESLTSINYWINLANKLIDKGVVKLETGKHLYEGDNFLLTVYERFFRIEYDNSDMQGIIITKSVNNSRISIYNEETYHQHNIDLSNNKIKKIYFTGLNDYIEIEDYMNFSDIGELTDDELMYIQLKYGC